MPIHKIAFVTRRLMKTNLWQTLYVNFKFLPLRQALKLPILMYGKVQWVNTSGQIQLDTSALQFGMIQIGTEAEVVISATAPTRMYLAGTWICKGPVNLCKGVQITVMPKATLTVGPHFSIGSLSKIVVFRQMTFGSHVLISWETQFFDTDFHYLINADNEIKDNCKPVHIGNEVWISTRVTVLKGTQMADRTVVAAGALCMGNYELNAGAGALLAGVPARCIRHGMNYITNKWQERKLYEYFEQNPGGIKPWEKM